MRKIFVFALAVSLFFNTFSLFAQDDDRVLTDGMLNGYAIVDMDKDVMEFYIAGLMDAADEIASGRIASLYPNMTIGEILDTVFDYYYDNPTERHRPIIDALLSGCR